MDQKVKKAIEHAVKTEPFARALDIGLVESEKGHSVVQLTYDPGKMNNIYERAHGGALFALIDEAFETAGQTDGTVAVALNEMERKNKKLGKELLEHIRKVGVLFCNISGKKGSIVKKHFRDWFGVAIEHAGHSFGDDYCARINGEKITGPKFCN